MRLNIESWYISLYNHSKAVVINQWEYVPATERYGLITVTGGLGSDLAFYTVFF